MDDDTTVGKRHGNGCSVQESSRDTRVEHEIRGPIKTLKQHSSMLSGAKGQKISSTLKQLDASVTDLHSASDEGNQADAETALKSIESALDQLRAQDPETAFKNMH
jgi:hypothetical protein